jgi:hypothetical protein
VPRPWTWTPPGLSISSFWESRWTPNPPPT